MVECKVALGGLMRCCLASLDEYLAPLEELPPEGTTVTCKYCHSTYGNMILKEDTWLWNNPKNPSL